MGVGERLRKERERLGLSQAAFAEKAGVHRNTQVSYERNKTYPDADYLAVIRSLGVDDTYVLTGTRSSDREAKADAADARALVLSAIADHLGIEADEIERFVEWVELLRTNELARKSFNIADEVKRLTWRLLIDHGVHGTWTEISDGRQSDGGLLFELIQRFETGLKCAESKGVALTIPAKARAIASVYLDAKRVGYVDSKMVDDAIKLANSACVAADRKERNGL